MINTLNDKLQQELLGSNYIGRLAFLSGEHPYIVPITYYYDQENNRIISYSSEGHKIKAMRKNKMVALCVDEINSVNEWRSVMIHGEFHEVTRIDAKFLLHKFSEGVKNVIMAREKKKLHFISEFSSKLESEGTPIVYEIRILDTTGKYRES